MPSLGRFRYLEALPKRAPGASASHAVPTVVLIHAFPLNARMYEPQLALADACGWRVIAPHLRGMDQPSPYGVSEATARPAVAALDPPVTSIDDYAGDVIDLLDALHIETAVIGGLSMGGYVTLAMFRHAPRYFRGILLADTRSQADTAEGIENRKKMLALVRSKGPGAVVDEMVPKLIGESTRRKKPDVEARLREIASSNSETAIAGAITAMMSRQDSTPLLSSIHCPTLVLVGEEDTLTPPPLSVEIHRGIAGSELVTIPGVGHLPSLEHPDLFNAALERFLTHRV